MPQVLTAAISARLLGESLLRSTHYGVIGPVKGMGFGFQHEMHILKCLHVNWWLWPEMSTICFGYGAQKRLQNPEDTRRPKHIRCTKDARRSNIDIQVIIGQRRINWQLSLYYGGFRSFGLRNVYVENQFANVRYENAQIM